MSTAARIGTCHGCLREHGAKCAGECVCVIDGLSIIDHASADRCPDGRYGPGRLTTVFHGAVGMMKAAMGIDRAADDTIADRLKACGGCPNVTTEDGKPATCVLCTCNLPKKVSIKGERCPVGKWEAV